MWREAAAIMSGKSDDQGATATEKAPHYHGHRARLRQRFLDAGSEAVSDYELLELILFRAIPQRDVKPLAKQLIATFGSFAEVIAAPRHRLAELKGLGGRCHHRAQGRAGGREPARARRSEQADCAVIMVERARLLPHRAGFRREGAVPHSLSRQAQRCHRRRGAGLRHCRSHSVYPREVIKRALELSATAIILVHNHPSGDPTPSRADIDMTKAIVDIAKPLGIAVHDHIIVGKHGHASLKGLRLF
jgi:DNA repair protein RadC